MKYPEKEIVTKYLDGKNTKVLASEYGTYNTSIRRILIRHNIKLRTNREIQAKVKSNPFSITDDYWIGLLATDGCVTNNNIVLDLHERDSNILKEYIKHIGVDLSILRQHSKTFDTSNQLRVAFKCISAKEWLETIGITPRKSKTLELKIPITWNMLRGIIDGDGCIIYINNKTGCLISINSSSEKFIKQIATFLTEEKIFFKIYTRRNGLLDLCIVRKESIIKCYNNLYTEDCVHMERKRNKIGSVVQKWMIKDSAKTGKESSSNPVLAGYTDVVSSIV